MKAGGSEGLVFELWDFSSTSQRSMFRLLQWSVVVSSDPENTGMLIADYTGCSLVRNKYGKKLGKPKYSSAFYKS